MDEPGVPRQAGNSSVAPLADTDAKVYRRRWIILGVLITSLMAIVLDNTVLNVALKTIADPVAGLGASQSQLEWAINSYTLVFAGLLFTFGVLGDRIGRKRMLMLGLASFGLFSLMTAYSHSPDQLVWARAAMGLGAAAVMPQTLSIISNVFDPAERPRAIGIWAVAVGIGIAIGPIVGGLLLAHFWWGSVFLINVPFCAASVVAIALLVPESKNPSPGRIDYIGVLASIAGLVLLVYGIIQGGDKGTWVHPDVLGPALGGLAILAFFVWYEARVKYPSLDVRLFRDARLSSAIGALSLVFFGMMGALFFLSFYLQSVRGYTPLKAGAFSLAFAVAQMVMAPRSAALVRRFGAKSVVATGLLLVTAALVSYQVLNVATPIWVLAAAFFVQGAGMGLVMPPSTEAVMSVVPRERAGRWFRADQHCPPGVRCARRSRARLHPGAGLPHPARAAPERPARSGAERRHQLDHREPRGGRQAGPGGPGPGGLRRRLVRARHAPHHVDLRGDHAARCARRDALDARPRRGRCRAPGPARAAGPARAPGHGRRRQRQRGRAGEWGSARERGGGARQRGRAGGEVAEEGPGGPMAME